MTPTMRCVGLALSVGLLAVSCGAESASPATSDPPQPQMSSAPGSVERPEPVVTEAPVVIEVPADTSTTTSVPSLPAFSELSQQLFDQTVLHEIDIEIGNDELALLDPPTDDRVPVRLTVDGSSVDAAGLRLKRGFGQFQGLDEKPGFSIETDEFVDGVTLFDIDRLTLGNSLWDHAFVNEQLVYELYRAAGVPAPRTALARVTVNGETFGLYVMRETYDERMLAQYFADPTGNLYEATGAHGAPDMGLELRTNERRSDTSDLAAIAEVIATASDDEYRDEIEELVDVDQLLTYWALEALTGNGDGFVYDLTAPGVLPTADDLPPGNPYPNNFYAYHDPGSGRFVFLPHGADLALGLKSWFTYVVGPSTPVLIAPKVDATVAARLWEDPAFRDELAERMRWVLDEIWDVQALIARTDMFAALVRADGLSGSRETITMTQFENVLVDRKDFLTASTRGGAGRTRDVGVRRRSRRGALNMDRRHFLRMTASLGMVVAADAVVVACGDDGPNAGTRGSTTTERRDVTSTTGTTPPTDVTTITDATTTTTTDRRQETTRYGPLDATPDANGLLLPAGFTSELLAVGGQLVVGTSYRWHVFADGGACFAARRRRLGLREQQRGAHRRSRRRRSTPLRRRGPRGRRLLGPGGNHVELRRRCNAVGHVAVLRGDPDRPGLGV